MADRGTPSGVADLTGALHVRQRRAARRRTRRVLAGVCVLVVLAVLAWAGFFSPLARVRGVEVRGVSLLSQDAVLDAAQVPLGGALMRVDTGAVAQRVEALPEVAQASVGRSWPHTVVITVTERQAVFQCNGTAGGYVWVDADGVAFHTGSTRLDVPLLITAGADKATLADVAQVLAGLPPDVAKALSTVAAPTADQITLHLSDGRQIVWGSAEESALKAQVIEVLLKQPGTIYDVSAPGHPAIR